METTQENEGREERKGTERLCRAYTEPGATYEKLIRRLAGGEANASPTYRAAIKVERYKLGHERNQTSNMSLQSSGS